MSLSVSVLLFVFVDACIYPRKNDVGIQPINDVVSFWDRLISVAIALFSIQVILLYVYFNTHVQSGF